MLAVGAAVAADPSGVPGFAAAATAPVARAAARGAGGSTIVNALRGNVLAEAPQPAGAGGGVRRGLPAPSASHLPALAPAGELREVDAVVTLPSTISPPEIQALTHTPGISAIEEVDIGTVQLAGRPARAIGVDPATFRDFTPAVTAQDTKLWQYVAAGALVSSYTMATDRKLSLGARLPIVPAGGGKPAVSGWLGALASIGIPGVDLVVSSSYSMALGLVPQTGLLVSAPLMDQPSLKQALSGMLPGADIELTSPAAVTASPSGQYMSPQMISTVISAALSRVGDPYVWGGNGPNEFDCSGLVGWAFAQAGVSMPRTAAQQYLAGPRVPLTALQPGDLLFWAYDPADPTFVDHVAMYLGNGEMVVAPHTGTDVQVDPVPTADLVGAVRVDPGMALQVGGPRFP